MLDDSNPLDAIWVDHDIRDPRVVSIGCHSVYPEIPVNSLSFNPHRMHNQHPDKCFKGKNSESRDKFPFSTSVLLAHTYRWFPEDEMSIMLLAHADSGYKVYNDYFGNVKAWADVFYDNNLKKIKNTDPSPMYESLKVAGYKAPFYQKPSVNVSVEANYINNIRDMAKFIDTHISMPEIKNIVSSKKFVTKVQKYSGGVDEDTINMLNNCLSYAVIYKKEISYTLGSI